MNESGTKIDMSAFQRAMRNVQSVSRKTPAEQCNQRAMNVARRMVETLPPKDIPDARRRVKRYMDEFVRMTRLKRNKSGKNKGKYKPLKKAKQLRRKHLIAQARNKKAGKKGLYGAAMSKAAGKLSFVSQISQGYLKSVFLPVIVGLYGFVKYRPPVSLTRYISRWEGSAGHGKVTPARRGLNPTAVVNLRVRVQDSQEAKVNAIYTEHAAAAIRAETIEMERHFDKQLEKELGRG